MEIKYSALRAFASLFGAMGVTGAWELHWRHGSLRGDVHKDDHVLTYALCDEVVLGSTPMSLSMGSGYSLRKMLKTMPSTSKQLKVEVREAGGKLWVVFCDEAGKEWSLCGDRLECDQNLSPPVENVVFRHYTIPQEAVLPAIGHIRDSRNYKGSTLVVEVKHDSCRLFSYAPHVMKYASVKYASVRCPVSVLTKTSLAEAEALGRVPDISVLTKTSLAVMAALNPIPAVYQIWVDEKVEKYMYIELSEGIELRQPYISDQDGRGELKFLNKLLDHHSDLAVVNRDLLKWSLSEVSAGWRRKKEEIELWRTESDPPESFWISSRYTRRSKLVKLEYPCEIDFAVTVYARHLREMLSCFNTSGLSILPTGKKSPLAVWGFKTGAMIHFLYPSDANKTFKK